MDQVCNAETPALSSSFQGDLPTNGFVDMHHHNLTTDTLLSVFEEAVEIQSGQIKETVNNGTQLFSRSLLPMVQEVRPNDLMQGGLALRATESEIWLHPYLFREVCRNGAIMAQTIESWHVEYSQYASDYEVIQSLREAIVVCSQEDVFTTAIGEVRELVHREIDMLLSLTSLLRGHQEIAVEFLSQIAARYTEGNDRSAFGLMNAITSIGRDTRDEEQRWRIEELGGTIGARLLREPLSDEARSGARRSVEALSTAESVAW